MPKSTYYINLGETNKMFKTLKIDLIYHTAGNYSEFDSKGNLLNPLK